MINSTEKRLEQYTLKHPQEVLLVTLKTPEFEDFITIFKGFSSSLSRPTAFDPDTPVFPENAQIISVDRLKSPYNPDNPSYIQQGLSWADMENLLNTAGI